MYPVYNDTGKNHEGICMHTHIQVVHKLKCTHKHMNRYICVYECM